MKLSAFATVSLHSQIVTYSIALLRSSRNLNRSEKKMKFVLQETPDAFRFYPLRISGFASANRVTLVTP